MCIKIGSRQEVCYLLIIIDEILIGILQKKENKRNLFDMRLLQKELSSNHFFKKLIEQENIEIYLRCLKLLGYKWAQPGDTIIQYNDIGDTFYVIIKGIVDVFCPCDTSVYLTIIEYNKLLSEYQDMLLTVNGENDIPEPNHQYQLHDAYHQISIKDIVNKLDGNITAVPEDQNKDESKKEINEELKDSSSENMKNSQIK